MTTKNNFVTWFRQRPWCCTKEIKKTTNYNIEPRNRMNSCIAPRCNWNIVSRVTAMTDASSFPSVTSFIYLFVVHVVLFSTNTLRLLFHNKSTCLLAPIDGLGRRWRGTRNQLLFTQKSPTKTVPPVPCAPHGSTHERTYNSIKHPHTSCQYSATIVHRFGNEDLRQWRALQFIAKHSTVGGECCGKYADNLENYSSWTPHIQHWPRGLIVPNVNATMYRLLLAWFWKWWWSVIRWSLLQHYDHTSA